MTERKLMLAGELYLPADPELSALRLRARLCRIYNSSEEDAPKRLAILRDLFGAIGERAEVEPDFRCDYGFNITAGDGLFMNFGCVILDCAPVTIGDRVLIGPGTHIYAATHPLDHEVRAAGRELARPVTIGNDVWIGGNVTICPGVTIGDRAVIGAGSVVIRDVPSGKVVAGNPARVIRSTVVS